MTMGNFNDTQNKQLVNTAIDELKLNPRTDAIPQQVIPTIQPVFELKRRVINVFKAGTASNGTGATLYTTPSDRDFYLVGAYLSVAKDASSTSVATSISATDADGVSIFPASISGISLQIQNLTQSNYYGPIGIKLKRNTTITVSNSTAVATTTSNAGIWGYTEETGVQFV